ncbi:MAG TPA: hypothetical protein PLL18_06105 [Flavobacteriales bacterium]|nr:hypothetical protein [Flavobacteriales bacterium]
MSQSPLFRSKDYVAVETAIKRFLNGQPDFISKATANSTRAVGDAIQGVLGEHFHAIIGKHGGNCTADFARRAMADLAFEDRAGNYCVVDVKTHRLDTHFNMPNLTSVERLSRFYEADNNFFVVLSIAYNVVGTKVEVRRVHFVPIEFLSWECLTIGALGWGQIQIANSNKITVLPNNPRKDWMLEFCEIMLEFYPKEIVKIDRRIAHFKKLRTTWKKR